MARMPTQAQGDFEATSTNVGQSDEEKQRNMDANWSQYNRSQTDPALNLRQRLDQRYANYTFGSDPDYAKNTADRLQANGSGLLTQFAGLGQNAQASQAAVQGRTAPVTDYTNANGALGSSLGTSMNQANLYGRLTAYADQGPGPSQAQAQLAASSAAAMRQQAALAGSGRGAGGGAAAYRQAAANQAQIQGAANAQASVLRAQEADAWRQRQLQAYGMGGQVLSQQGDLQLGQAQQYAGMSQFQTDAALRAQAQNDQAAISYGGQAADALQAGAQTQLGYEGEARANYGAELGAGMGYEENVTNLAIGRMHDQESEGTDWMGAALGVAAAAAPVIGMVSDERQKKDIKNTDLSRTYAALGGTETRDHDGPADLAEMRKERDREKRERQAAIWANAPQRGATSIQRARGQ